jgi:hypothetical protein
MKTKLLMTVATAALIGSAGLVSAQTPGNVPNAPAAAQPAPPAGAPAEKAAPMNREAPAGEMKGQRAQDNNRDGMKSKGAETTRDPKVGKSASDTNLDDTKTDRKNAADRDGMKGDQKNASDRDGMKADQKNTAGSKAGATTGQAGAGAKLTTEQRTTIRTSITKQNIRPVTNVNFSISVGTRVPRTVTFYPLPAEVITIYPGWRGYEFFLVNDEIVVVNPRTLEIVAVLEA